jgi:hypothetical protein
MITKHALRVAEACANEVERIVAKVQKAYGLSRDEAMVFISQCGKVQAELLVDEHGDSRGAGELSELLGETA